MAIIQRLLASLAATLLLCCTASTAWAAQPLISIDTSNSSTGTEPFIGGAIVVERTEGRFGGDPDGWRMNMDIYLKNDSPSDLVLTDVVISYAGGSDPSDNVLNAAAHHADIGQWIMIDAPDWDLTGNQIDVNQTERQVQVPEHRVNPFPVPDSVTVELFFDGFADPISVTRDLAEYTMPSALGSYAFPGAAKDLPAGHYWANGKSHTLASHHRVFQRFAEDWGVTRWDGAGWTGWRISPSDPYSNEDGLIWGKPVYAIADGTVVACGNGFPDNLRPFEKDPGVTSDPPSIPGGGNHLKIRDALPPGPILVAPRTVFYAHFKHGSIPEELCPEDPGELEQEFDDGASVSAGQFLGLVGNSGNSGGPHLHIQSDTSGHGATPLLYHNSRSLQEDYLNPFDPVPPWNTVSHGAVSSHDSELEFGVFVEPLPRANVAVSAESAPAPAVAGTPIMATIEVTNHGPDADSAVTVTDTLPPGFDYQSDTGSCVEGPANVLTCPIGVMFAQDVNGTPDMLDFEVAADIPADLVFNNGGPVVTTNTVEVAGVVFDDSLADDTFAEEITVIAEADLSIVSLAVSAPPDVLIGEDAQGLATARVTSAGPSSPMHATIAVAGTTGGADAIPDEPDVFVSTLEAGSLRELEIPFTIVCNEPGTQSIALSGEITPFSDDDVDPNGANNGMLTQPIQVECVVPVALNIKPGSDPNSIHPDKGTIPTAVLTTAVGEYGLPIAFDAMTIDALSVRFGDMDLVWTQTGGAPERHQRGHLEDTFELDEATMDGDIDMVLHFEAAQSGLTTASTMGCIRGLFADGADTFAFFGCDAVRIVPGAE